MKDKFNWVYFVFALISLAAMFVFFYKGMDEYGWKMFICLEFCLFHINLNEIEWKLKHGKQK